MMIQLFHSCFINHSWNATFQSNVIFLKYALQVVKLEQDALGYDCGNAVKLMMDNVLQVCSIWFEQPQHNVAHWLNYKS